MRRQSWIFCAVLLASSAFAASQYALPRSAVINIGRAQFDPKDNEQALICPSWTLTAAQLRSKFRTYHLLKPGELHAFYVYPACWIEGTATVHGKTFSWQARPGNTLNTDWPDGVDKQLGGKHSDNPSGRP